MEEIFSLFAVLWSVYLFRGMFFTKRIIVCDDT